jgi:peptidyl-prolyl cis-trans isomerase C
MYQRNVRRRARPVALLAVVLACTALLASCNKSAKTGDEASTTAGSGKVLAKVDGSAIYQSDFDSARALLPAQYQSLPDSVLMPALMDQLIDRRVVVLAAEKAGLDKDPKVKREMEQAREDVLQSAYLKDAAKKSITEDQIKKRYEEKVKSFVPQEEVRARHILTKDRGTAETAYERVKSGEKFAVVAGEMSIDSSAQHGGDLGYFKRNQMVKPFSDEAFKLKVGEVSKPFKTQYGWHVVKVIAHRMSKPPTLAQSEDAIRNELTSEFIRSKVATMRSDAKVEKMYAAAPVQPPQAATPDATSGSAKNAAPVVNPEAAKPAAANGGK